MEPNVDRSKGDDTSDLTRSKKKARLIRCCNAVGITLGIKEERTTEGQYGTMLLSLHVGADRTLYGFDCCGSDGAVAWVVRAGCYGNAGQCDPHRRARRGCLNLRSGRRRIDVRAEKVSTPHLRPESCSNARVLR